VSFQLFGRRRTRADALPDHRSARPAAPPAWVRAADVVCVCLAALAAGVAVSGGFQLEFLGVPLKVRSPGRILLWAAAVAGIRHVVFRRPAIHEDIVRRLAEWRQSPTSSAWWVADTGCRRSVGAPDRRRGMVFVIAMGALFTAATFAITAPLIWHIGNAVHDPGDPLLNLWILDWVAYQLRTDPVHLFDGNIFSPNRWTLAYSETLLAPSAVATPLLWLGASRVLTYNIVFVSGFILSGVGAALLVRRLSGSVPAAVVSGVIFAFLPFRFDHYPQLQLQQAQWIPLAFWAYHRVLNNGRPADGVLLGASLAGQLLSCMYYGVYLVSHFVVVGGALLFAYGALDRVRLRAIVLAIVVATALFAPAGYAYVRARAVVGERAPAEVAARSATWRHYLAAPQNNRLLGWTAARYGAAERNLYPGVVAVALSAAALWPPLSAVRLAYAVGLAWGVMLTFGMNAPVYRTLFEYVPLFRALRIPALAVILVGFSLAVLAGFGFVRIARTFRRPHAATWMSIVCCLAIVVESCPTPMQLNAVAAAPPPIYTELLSDVGSSPPVPIVEIPVMVGGDQIYMYYATFHRQRLLNGYSGFFPPSYLQLAGAMQRFPDAHSLLALRARGARYALVHGEFLEPSAYLAVTHAADECGCGLTLLGRRPWVDREISLYRIEY
jgi:multisubunit Na+/H+ antiporter MnhG subunit